MGAAGAVREIRGSTEDEATPGGMECEAFGSAEEREREKVAGEEDGSEIWVCGPVLNFLGVNVYGKLRTKVLGQLRKEKPMQGTRQVSLPGIPGGDVTILSSRSSKYELQFHNELFYAEITTWKNLPGLRIQYKSETLLGYDLDGLADLTDEIAACFMDGSYRVQASRVDLAVDFQSPGFEIPSRRDVITRARSRLRDTRTGSQPRDQLDIGRKGSRLMAVIYNKSMSIENGDQHYWLDHYREVEWFDEDLDVYRAELRFGREILRDMRNGEGHGIESIRDLKESLGDLLTYALGDEDGQHSWLRFCSPEDREQDSRPSAGWWSEITSSFKRGLVSSDRVRKSASTYPDYSQDIKMALAYNLRLAAHLKRSPLTSGKDISVRDFPPEMARRFEDELARRNTDCETEVALTMEKFDAQLAKLHIRRDAA